MAKLVPLAIIYDFDGTLAPGNMQERNFIPETGMTTKNFWDQVAKEAKKHEADEILVYMRLMLKRAEAAEVQVRKQNFKKYGEKLDFFKGVIPERGSAKKGWFDRINEYGRATGVKVEHYIVSSGIREMIKGSSISRRFRAIYASSFFYDYHGIATWPALAVNYTTKTQYIFRINKGCLNIEDKKGVNKFIPHEDRPIPFSNMVYIGDGETDIPCFRLIKDKGGYAIAVYKPQARGAKTIPDKLKKEGRVNIVLPADYREDKSIDKFVKALIDKLAVDNYFKKLKTQKPLHP